MSYNVTYGSTFPSFNSNSIGYTTSYIAYKQNVNSTWTDVSGNQLYLPPGVWSITSNLSANDADYVFSYIVANGGFSLNTVGGTYSIWLDNGGLQPISQIATFQGSSPDTGSSIFTFYSSYYPIAGASTTGTGSGGYGCSTSLTTTVAIITDTYVSALSYCNNNNPNVSISIVATRLA